MATTPANVDMLVSELKYLLVRYKSFLNEECSRHEIRLLKQWMYSYRRGIVTPDEMARISTAWLSDLCHRLKLAAEKMQQLENESGISFSKRQARRIEELMQSIPRLSMPSLVLKKNAKN